MKNKIKLFIKKILSNNEEIEESKEFIKSLIGDEEFKNIKVLDVNKICIIFKDKDIVIDLTK